MNIQQLSVTYQAEQDRILLRIMTADSQELQLLFTRKLIIGLWPLLQRVVIDHTAAFAASQPNVAAIDPAARQAMAEFSRAATLAQADFTTPYKAEVKWRPLGAEPLLITEVRLSPQSNGRISVHFSEKLPERLPPRAFDMMLEQALLHGLVQLLQQAIEASQWLVALAPSADQPMLNAPVADERPQYLN